MSIKLGQSLKQSQQLKMTPQLQQAIKLLTLTHIEMTDVISQEMVENPMLEEMGGESTKEEIDNNKSLKDFEAKAEDFKGPDVVDKKTDDFDWDKYIEAYNTNSSTPSSASKFNGDDDQPNYENMVSNEQSLQDHLEWQARMGDLMGEELNIALAIIHNIDDDGFLELDLEELLKDNSDRLELAQSVLEVIKKFDPIGCGSKNTKEALLVQARNIPGGFELCEKIIANHLQDLYQRQYAKIAKVNETTEEHVREAELSIMNFHPRPGRLISPERIQYVVPDIYVTEVSGELVVKLNNEGVPRLKISKMYQQLLKNKDAKTKEYVQEKLRGALWLIQSIENRQKTIMKVAIAIVKYQPDFFKKGAEFLKPMILKDIAREVEMHESTISRVTTNKFMHCPLGTFELKYFFSSGVGAGKGGGTDIASESLKLKIKAMIAAEDIKKPLSDQKISTLLGASGIIVARRTVAKYREALGILSSAKRKRK